MTNNVVNILIKIFEALDSDYHKTFKTCLLQVCICFDSSYCSKYLCQLYITLSRIEAIFSLRGWKRFVKQYLYYFVSGLIIRPELSIWLFSHNLFQILLPVESVHSTVLKDFIYCFGDNTCSCLYCNKNKVLSLYGKRN